MSQTASKLEYPECSMFDLVRQTAEKNPDNIAYDFFGKRRTFSEWVRVVEDTARALIGLHVRKGDTVTVCLPNIPQAVDIIYALNRIGAVANIMHPLSAVEELSESVSNTKSKLLFISDTASSDTFGRLAKLSIEIIIIRMRDDLPWLKRIGYAMMHRDGRSKGNMKVFVKGDADAGLPSETTDCRDTAIILYSGGTTGKMKGVRLSSYNFNALALQTIAASGNGSVAGSAVASVLPIFHGFGLGVGIHTALAGGATCVLIPRFNAEDFIRTVVRKQINFIFGVPTLFEAILNAKTQSRESLSCLKGVFCGGDSLSESLEKRINEYLQSNGASIRVRQGYGTTESIAVNCLMPSNVSRSGCVGLPTADTEICITDAENGTELAYGCEGEICICGPTVMQGYLSSDSECENLRLHNDGKMWFHTGDMGKMDSDGYLYFIQRIKRMIISSGYNIYPSRIEEILATDKRIRQSCVVGVTDRYKMQEVWAFAEVDGDCNLEILRQDLQKLCISSVAKYAVPSRFEFCDLPMTKVNKIDYRALERLAQSIKEAETKKVK